MNTSYLDDKSATPGIKLLASILAEAETIVEDLDLDNPVDSKFEIILLLSGHAVKHAYGKIPHSIERFQKDYFPTLMSYTQENNFHKKINIDVGNFVNSRFQLYNSQLDMFGSPDNKIPTKLPFYIFEDPLQVEPGENINLAQSMKLMIALKPSLKRINNAVEIIIKNHY